MQKLPPNSRLPLSNDGLVFSSALLRRISPNGPENIIGRIIVAAAVSVQPARVGLDELDHWLAELSKKIEIRTSSCKARIGARMDSASIRQPGSEAVGE